MYLPLLERNQLGHAAIAVVDIGAAGNVMTQVPALITDIDLGTPDFATATGGNSHAIVATSATSRNVWVIDPRTDTLTATFSLDERLGVSHFSGTSAEGAFVTGVAVDSSPCSDPTTACGLGGRAILSVWNGFALVDIERGAVIDSFIAPPSENFGFDGVGRQIIAPFYDCEKSQDADGRALGTCVRYPLSGLNIIDVRDGTVYSYHDPTAADSTIPLGREPDSAAADPQLHVIVVASEDDDVNVINLAQATVDPSTRTVTAPRKAASVTGSMRGVPRLTGVAIEQTHHYAFLEEEGNRPQDDGNGAGVLKLDDFLGGRASLVVAKMQQPGGQAWRNMGDPHGIAVSTGLDGNHALGFLVESQQRWVARVDLQTFAATGRLDSATTFLDTRTKGMPTATVVNRSCGHRD